MVARTFHWAVITSVIHTCPTDSVAYATPPTNGAALAHFLDFGNRFADVNVTGTVSDSVCFVRRCDEPCFDDPVEDFLAEPCALDDEHFRGVCASEADICSSERAR